jgi:apolipoprotein N-acyltransferase
VGRYDKVHLVPVGEYVPLRDYIPFVSFVESVITNQAGFLPNVTPGKGGQIFSLPAQAKKSRFGILICYENIFPDQVRDSVLRGAEYIVNISNDGWFADSAELDQVLAITAFRAVENRITLFRATNTGISAVFDPNGAVRNRLVVRGRDKEVEGVFAGRVFFDGRRTFYTRFGDLFAKAFLALAFFLILLTFFAKRGNATRF